MREILFRGKRSNDGKWIYGSYVYQYGANMIYLPDGTDQECGFDYYHIVPETVGQYTGLTDKNGKKIFEGDIVRTQPFSDRPYSKKAKFKQHIGVVEYYIRRHNLREQDYEAGWQVKIKDYGGYGCCDWSAFFQCEVIGNIFENADLLEG